ncbi:MAG: DUF6498-containing protein [Dokdonella sp.]
MSVLVANAVVFIIALVNDLSLIEILMVYCCEAVWIGVFGALRLIVASILGDPYRNRWAELDRGSSLLASIAIIVTASSSYLWIPGVAFGAVLYAEHLLNGSGADIDDLRHLWLVVGTSFVFFGSHALSFLAGFLGLGEFRRARVGDLVLFPFKRSLALLVSMLAGLAVIVLLPAMASAQVFALSVIALKLLLDLRLYRDPDLSTTPADAPTGR